MNFDIRQTRTEAEHRTALGVAATVSLESPPSDECWERHRDDAMNSFSLSAWDGDRCVGSIAEAPVETVVPGGALLPTSAVTGFGVLPTTSCRDGGRALVERLISDSTTRGHALMKTRVKESATSVRCGFGIAGDSCSVEVDAATARPVMVPDVAGRMKILSADEVLKVVPELYERVGLRRPGAVTRDATMWNRSLDSAAAGKEGSFVAVHCDTAGSASGYVQYDVCRGEGSNDVETGEGRIHDLFATDARVELGLWSFLLSLEHVTVWRSSGRPVDDVARFGLEDARVYRQMSCADEQWLRIVDIDVALPGRTYNPVDRSVVIQVTDPLMSSNTGTWRIDGFGAFRSHDRPELLVGIDALSAAYLGGTAWWMLEATGRVKQRSAGAIESADLLFASRPAPFCGTTF